MTVPVAATIAGSDSGGGAGIQADLKTFAALGVYGASAIVALTAQNTVGVRGVQTASLEMVALQIDAIAEDLSPDAWKTGMLASTDIIDIVVARLRHHRARNLVVDPVMVAKSGDRLLDVEAVGALVQRLLPLALVLTPNLPEAAAMTGLTIDSPSDARRAARELAELGPRLVVVKGGHAGTDPVVDVVYDANSKEWTELRNERVRGHNTHGTGCTFSAAIAANLARGADPLEAVNRARQYLQAALRWAPGIGSGHGPLGHMGPQGNAPAERYMVTDDATSGKVDS
ncbi:MAG TPA: bifunctional hydroxymethylpyrimidine kinase/phosphomethylpyrimidine kinase [Candidatus Dormibacteraeota bacterium]|jgi:hydroxymethylpyrimidine/phosphomethylpyrimidine kinase|nr:bifunctional hydroxymethylpyrimidine kinase/phosphomethylpyrimidine kinase [Candidatus Dormibacteraeota bacterium]